MQFKYKNFSTKLDLTKFFGKQRTNSSNLHKKIREEIESVYPYDKYIEEFPLPGTKPKLYADFFIPSRKIIIECQGDQHYEYTPFFHKNKYQFYKSQANDRIKREWCEENEIELIEVTENDINITR